MLATALASPVYACPRPAHHSPVLPPVVLAAEISSACEISSSRRPPTLILPSLAYGSTSSPRSPLRAVMPPHITPRHRPILPPAIPAADISPAREISSSWRPPTPNLPSLACGARPRDLLVLAAAALSASMTQPQQRRISAASSWCGDAAAGDAARSRSTTLRRGLLPQGHQLQDHGGQGVQRHAWRSKLVAAMRLLVCRCADAPARRVARSVAVWPVIGKSGANVRRVEQQTGARIKVQEIDKDASGERLIIVSSNEIPTEPISPTIEALILLHDKVAGPPAIARGALTEIASRLRTRTLRDTSTANNPPPFAPSDDPPGILNTVYMNILLASPLLKAILKDATAV
ncbi:hypothetical protein Zm00014a_018094 [Zea mays]|uniref:K Homology domain-containing protein n=1 Tax=Zea mays TaxID=4577 RepID=A0A3L6FGB6_MAIZE|nr:hypothetical protein Zm00014a_018094 [Zea mays]